jgi:F-type H+-transporting ATPase subunit b
MSAFITLLAESPPPPEAHAPQLIDLDWTIFVQLGLFLFLGLMLTKLLWRPYLRVRTERVTRVDGYRKDAARMEADAAVRLARAEAGLAEARRLGSGERSVARAEAQAHEQKLMAGAQAEAQRLVSAARTRLDATVATERARLEAGAREIARQAARRILGREVTPS